MAGSSRFAIAITALCGASAVALGAFGAHGLKPLLVSNGTEETWRTAAHYHLAHSLALLAWTLWLTGKPRPKSGRVVVWLWAAGIMLFSGSVYGLALKGPWWLGPVTPVGGTALLAGWVVAGWVLWREEGRA